MIWTIVKIVAGIAVVLFFAWIAFLMYVQNIHNS